MPQRRQQQLGSVFRRYASRLLVFVLLGAIINIAVAWVCAALVRRPLLAAAITPAYSTASNVSSTGQRAWDRFFGPAIYIRSRTDGADIIAPRSSPGLGNHVFLLFESQTTYRGLRDINLLDTTRAMAPSMSVVQAGWPLVALESEVISGPLQSPWIRVTELHGAFEVPAGSFGPLSWPKTQLPLRPLWLGFSVNTLAYASLAVLLSGELFRMRRWLRQKNNLCTACAYPIGTSPVCTECGKPVRARSVEPTA